MKKQNNIQLTSAQKEALSTTANIFVEAGAGSGKTTILVQRILKILEEHPQLEIFNILAITFTQKAAGEMLNRIQNTLQSNDCPLPPSTRDRVFNSLGQAKISTIHAFCNSVLRKYPAEAKIDPNFAVLESAQTLTLQELSIEKTLTLLQKEKSNDLRNYLITFSSAHLKSDLLTLLKDSSMAETWVNIYLEPTYQEETLKTIIEKDPDNSVPTITAFKLLKALGNIFQHCLSQYQHEKTTSGKCDYNDLLIITEHLLQNNSEIRKQYQKMFQFIMVDEFQDTDPLQWKIIKYLAGNKGNSNNESPFDNKKLFLVGDIKQSIYSFRGADAYLFPEAMSDFLKNEHTSTIVHLTDNFRSQKPLIDFFNILFEILFQEKGNPPIPYTPLTIKNGKKQKGNAEVAILSTEQEQANYKTECEFIAQWIKKKISEDKSLSFKDFAILLRRKKNMEHIKDHLSKFNIPSTIYSGKGLLREEEIIDLYNLIKGLENPKDNIAWIAILKSPLFGISDETLFLLYSDFPGTDIMTKLEQFPEQNIKGLTSKSYSKIDIKILNRAYILASNWLNQRNFIPISNLANHILNQTGAWIIYKHKDNGPQKIINIKSFLKRIKKLETVPFTTLSDIRFSLDQSIKNPHVETDDTITLADENTVAILSIHAAKGLEFPVVIIPECSHKFNFNSQQRLLVNKDEGIGLSYKSKDNHKNTLRTKILQAHKQSIIEEEKRIFYVACTRAMDHLLIIGAKKQSSSKNNSFNCYLDFIEHSCINNPLKNCLSLERNNTSIEIPLYTNFLSEITPLELAFNKENQIKPNTAAILTFSRTLSQNSQLENYRPISTSDLIAYLICKKRYQLQPLINKLPATAVSQFSNTKKKHKTPIAAHAFGTITHKAFEIFNKKPESKPKQIISETISPLLYSQETKSKIATLLEKQILSFSKSKLFSKIHNATNQYHEKAFSLKRSPFIIDGRIDTIIQTDNSWQVIDYKTDQIEESEIKDHAAIYYNQMGIYLLALKTMFNLDIEQYHAYIYFTWLGISYPLTFTKEALSKLHEKISHLPENNERSSITKETCQKCPYFQFNKNCP
jgi:ATP-dependent helicase/nuclease subunit A